LRAVSGFLQLLEKEYAGLIGEKGNKYIRFALDGAERMKRLIHDLLEYSRVGTNRDDTGLTDMNEVVQETLKNLNKTLQETQALVNVEPLPVLEYARKPQMLQLMQNLISNALKYCDAERPEIRIGAKEEDQQWVVFVQDNGIGIEPHHREKMFIIFQRLHSRNEYSGTGIGLSICKKIVDGHGGTIWVDGKPGRGSTFYFSLDKRRQDLSKT
jgi:light-regulated signal transduction histidine kinase (bacteriophytochrome)